MKGIGQCEKEGTERRGPGLSTSLQQDRGFSEQGLIEVKGSGIRGEALLEVVDQA